MQVSQPNQNDKTAESTLPPAQTQTRKWNIADSNTTHNDTNEQNELSNTASTEGQLRELVGGTNGSKTGTTMTTTVTDTDRDIESQMERLMAQINERNSRTSSSQQLGSGDGVLHETTKAPENANTTKTESNTASYPNADNAQNLQNQNSHSTKSSEPQN